MSETSRYRHLTVPYCKGNGVDIGSGGDPVVPTAIQVELLPEQYSAYRSGDVNGAPIQWHGTGLELPFKDLTLDYVYSSHLLEDFEDWTPILKEWSRVLKYFGKLIILIPDKERFGVSVKNGQPPNLAHKHEGRVGELSTYAESIGVVIIEDRFTDLDPGDYTILFVGEKQ